VVNKTLLEINKEEKPTIVVFNKTDAFSYTPKADDDLTPRTKENVSLEELQQTWMAKMHDNCIFISAKDRTNMEALRTLFYEKVKEIHVMRFPYNDFLYQPYNEEDFQ
jgi:GTPase